MDGTPARNLRIWGALLLLGGFGLALAAVAFQEADENVPVFFLLPVATGLAVAGGVAYHFPRRVGGPATPTTARINDGLAMLGVASGFGAVAAAGLAGWVAAANGAWCASTTWFCGGNGAVLAGIASVLALLVGMPGSSMVGRGEHELEQQRRKRGAP